MPAPPPPVSTWAFSRDELYPPNARWLADKKELGGLFTYVMPGGRRTTVLADVDSYPVIFAPDELGKHTGTARLAGVGDAVKMEMDKIGHIWFGIPKPILEHQRAGLDSLRKRVLNPGVCPRLNDRVGAEIARLFSALPDDGVVDLLRVACATFPGVNAAMFGGGAIPDTALDDFFAFDEEVAKCSLGIPKSPKYWELHGRITALYHRSFRGGVSAERCPATAARLAPIPPSFGDEDRAKFMVSLFWAPQANTLPVTFWVLAHVLRHAGWRERIRGEAAAARLGAGGAYAVRLTDPGCLPFTRACVNEVMRLYIANSTIRRVSRDCEIELSTGARHTLPKGHLLTLSSYVTHYDPAIFAEPLRFDPLRWLDAQGRFDGSQYTKVFLPFGKGRYQCSGKHLAMLEIPALVALFLRDFDAELLDPIPEADWGYVAGSVRPKGWPHGFRCRARCRRRAAAAGGATAGAPPPATSGGSKL